MRETLGLVAGTKDYIETTRDNAAKMSGARKAGYYVACAVAFPIAAVLGTGEHVLSRLKSGRLERK